MNKSLNPADPADFSDAAFRRRILNDPEADGIELSFVDNQVEEVASGIYERYRKKPMFLGKVAMSLAGKAAKSL